MKYSPIKPSRKLEDHIRSKRPPVADERSEEYKEVQSIIREEFSTLVPHLVDMPRLYSRANFPKSSYQFDTYEEFLAQPYRGPIGEIWCSPAEAAYDVGDNFSWRPFIVGTLIISDIRLLAIKEDVIVHLDRPIAGETVHVQRNGFDGVATSEVFSWDLSPTAVDDMYPVRVSFAEETLANVVGNHWRYQFSEDSACFVPCSPRQAKRNWLKGKIRYRVGNIAGDDAARISDLSRLIRLLLATVHDRLDPEMQVALAPFSEQIPDLETVRRICEREAAIKTIMENLGYPNVSDD